MYNEISLQFFSLIYIIILATVYFVKRRYNFIESKFYKALLGVTTISLILDIINIYIKNSNLTEDIKNITNITSFIYCISIFFWLTLFIVYIVLSMSNKKYEKFRELTKDYPIAYPIIIIIIVLFSILVFREFGHTYNFIDFFYDDIQLIYIFGLITSSIIMIILLIFGKKIASYKNWSILISTLILVIICYTQIANPTLPIIGSGICLITLFQYFTMENPDLKYIDELNALKVKAEDANEAKTSFLASMSHEIRTPMNVIIGLSENMLKGDVPEDLKEDIKNINESGTILLEIINNILDITKVEEGKTTLNNNPYSLADTIAKVSHMTKISLIDKPIKFNVQINGSIPTTLMGDEVKLYQILMNILSNAVKYTKKGSIDFIIESVINGNKDTLTFKIKDTGIGIKKADNDKLFKQFERLDQENSDIQGTGLGLVITKKLTDLMGGKISFESEYQKGTTFTVVVEQQIVDASKVDFSNYKSKKVTVDEYFDGSNYSVLVVDDNLLNLKVAEKLLKNYKLNITCVKSGIECLNITKKTKFDLILMDHMMPEMDGIITLNNLKNRASGFDTPVVVLTANAIDGSMEMYLKEGFCDYLSKPIDQVELDRILREQLKIDDNGNNTLPNNQNIDNNTIKNSTNL